MLHGGYWIELINLIRAKYEKREGLRLVCHYRSVRVVHVVRSTCPPSAHQ